MEFLTGKYTGKNKHKFSTRGLAPHFFMYTLKFYFWANRHQLKENWADWPCRFVFKLVFLEDHFSWL